MPLPDPTRPQSRDIVLVRNPQAGNYRRVRRRLSQALRDAGVRVVAALDLADLHQVRAWCALPPAGRPVIVAAGGDGTVGTVAELLAGSDTTFGILPLGTNNNVARSLGIPARVEDAARLLTHGSTVAVDLGRFIPDAGAPRSFLHAAGLGIQADFARLAADTTLRRRLGRYTYLVATALALRRRRPVRCDLILNGRRQSRWLLYLMVFNVPLFAGPLQLHLAGGIADRRFDVLAIDVLSLPRFLLALAPMLRGRRPRGPGVHVERVSRLRIDSPRPLAVSLDGEVAGHIPGTFVIMPAALQVIAPPSGTAMASRRG
jgi:diacylglycerol kinase family enzyme